MPPVLLAFVLVFPKRPPPLVFPNNDPPVLVVLELVVPNVDVLPNSPPPPVLDVDVEVLPKENEEDEVVAAGLVFPNNPPLLVVLVDVLPNVNVILIVKHSFDRY